MHPSGERQDDGPACSPANPREPALAADLITASLIRLLVVPGQYPRAMLLHAAPEERPRLAAGTNSWRQILAKGGSSNLLCQISIEGEVDTLAAGATKLADTGFCAAKLCSRFFEIRCLISSTSRI